MNKYATLLLAIFLFPGCSQPGERESLHPGISDSEVLDELFLLSDNQNFFALQSSFEINQSKLSEDHASYFTAIIQTAFNKPQESNLAISRLIESNSNTIHDTLMQRLYRLKVLNHTNLYEYELANQTSDLLLKNYSDILDSLQIADLDNSNKIWAALKDVPKQKVTRNQDFTMPLVRDIAGLFNVDVTFSDTTKNLIFDTGANFSVIRRSLVEQFGLTLIKSDFMVDGSTGSKVKSDLAIADHLAIGGLNYENVVFLVIEDKDLSFPGYDIYGIIGYPVIEAMKEIHITKDDRLFVPEKLTPYSHNNFALDGFVPLVSVKQKDDKLIFQFDTGASSTSLYSNYFRKYKDQIETNYQKVAFYKGSAGGIVEFEGYSISGISFSIAGSVAKLDSLQVHIDSIPGDENNFHGNMGQDFIKQFDKMIISFEYSSIVFE